MSGAMDGTVLALFLAATFVGGVATGLAGFAFGLVVSGVWLHIITPVQTASLIVGYGLFVQSYGIWKTRHVFNWSHVIPLIIGVVVGAPIGAWLLHYTNPTALRFGVGLLLIAYGAYGLLRPQVKGVPANVPVELGVGVVNGLLGGMTGLAGVFVTIWCGMRGWSKDAQRSVYQPVILASFVATAISLIAAGAATREFGKLYLLGAPALLAGMLLGFKLYGHLDDEAFRKVILVLLLLSGLALALPQLLAI
jgi:uncharacterized membrane protein YfcA